MGRSANWLQTGAAVDNNNIDVAFRLIGLRTAKKYFAGTARANEFDSLMESIGATLRSRQRANGGWVWKEGVHVVSDSMVTAMVDVALDTLNPSPDSPEVRKAIQFVLGSQQADGSWNSPNFNFATLGLACDAYPYVPQRPISISSMSFFSSSLIRVDSAIPLALARAASRSCN